MSIKDYKNVFTEIWVEIPVKKKYIMFYILGFISCFIFLLISFTNLDKITKKYPKDNLVEEAVERYIKEYTGSDIDLSP